MTDNTELTAQYGLKEFSFDSIRTDTPGFVNSRQLGSKNVDELKDSIRANGLLSPPVVWEIDGAAHLIAGFRRLQALRELSQEVDGPLNGLSKVACTVFEGDLDGAIAVNAIENLQRKDLHSADVMDLMERLSARGKTQMEVAESVGWSQSTVSTFLGLSRTLSADSKQAWRDGRLELKHAKQLATLTHKDGKPNVEAQAEALEKLTSRSSVNELGVKKPTKERAIRSRDEILGLKAKIVADGEMDPHHRASVLTLMSWYTREIDDGDVMVQQPAPPVSSAQAVIKEAKRPGRPAKPASDKPAAQPKAEGAPKRSLKDRAAAKQAAEAPAAAPVEVPAQVEAPQEAPVEVAAVAQEG